MRHASNAFWAALGWLVPGLGHILRGERTKGAIYAATLLGCFAAGEIMSERRAVPWLLDCGIMYTCVAGLLNFVLVVDLLFPRPGGDRAAGQTGRAAPAPSQGGARRD